MGHFWRTSVWVPDPPPLFYYTPVVNTHLQCVVLHGTPRGQNTGGQHSITRIRRGVRGREMYQGTGLGASAALRKLRPPKWEPHVAWPLRPRARAVGRAVTSVRPSCTGRHTQSCRCPTRHPLRLWYGHHSTTPAACLALRTRHRPAQWRWPPRAGGTPRAVSNSEPPAQTCHQRPPAQT